MIDTETNWADQVMSIGCCLADADTFTPLEMKYHILPIECQIGGIYYDALFLDTPVKPILCTRAEAMSDLRGYGVEPMLRMLSGDRTYRETHNAMFDAVDELEIMRLMGHHILNYFAL